MAKQIIWTKRAEQRLHEMLAYLENEGSIAAGERLFAMLTKRLEWLSRYPEAGRQSPKFKTMRFFKFARYKVVCYRVVGSKLLVSNFFDQRQDPEKRPY